MVVVVCCWSLRFVDGREGGQFQNYFKLCCCSIIFMFYHSGWGLSPLASFWPWAWEQGLAASEYAYILGNATINQVNFKRLNPNQIAFLIRIT